MRCRKLGGGGSYGTEYDRGSTQKRRFVLGLRKCPDEVAKQVQQLSSEECRVHGLKALCGKAIAMTDKLQFGFDFAAGQSYVPSWKQKAKFDGETFDQQQDGARLGRQLESVFELMRDGKWRTLREIAASTKKPEASVSARLRDLRKEKFGSWNVESRRIGDGLFEYRVSEKGSQQ